MNYINNWITQLTAPLSAGATVLPISPAAAARLDLTGSYLLTLVNSMNPLEQTLCEIVKVSAGLTLDRGLEGTAPESWPAETVIYCALTAGQLTALQQQVLSLQQRVDDCCGQPVSADNLTDQDGNALTDSAGNLLVLGGSAPGAENALSSSFGILTDQQNNVLIGV